jgi:hypothetical protein
VEKNPEKIKFADLKHAGKAAGYKVLDPGEK